MNRFVTCCLFLCVVGCGKSDKPAVKPTPAKAAATAIDGTSAETFKASVDSMRAGLTLEERKLLEEGITSARRNSGVPGSIERTTLDDLHGKTAAEIIDMGRRVIAAKKKVDSGQEAAEHSLFSNMVAVLRRENSAKLAPTPPSNLDSEFTPAGIRIWGNTLDDDGKNRTYEAEAPLKAPSYVVNWIKVDGKLVYEDKPTK